MEINLSFPKRFFVEGNSIHQQEENWARDGDRVYFEQEARGAE